MKLKVIYLDDEPDLCDLFADSLESDDWSIFTFSDPREALGQIEHIKPDMIFVDYRMPKLNGDEFCFAVGGEVPKFLITGDLELKARYPFKRIFHKPYNISEVRSLLQEYHQN